jgi:tellurite resistance protein TerC
VTFVLSGAAERFKYVQPGLALVLVFVGVKMTTSDWVKIPVLVSLAVIVVLVGGSIVASLVSHARQRRGPQPGGDTHEPGSRRARGSA